jgi:hypothetical protein
MIRNGSVKAYEGKALQYAGSNVRPVHCTSGSGIPGENASGDLRAAILALDLVYWLMRCESHQQARTTEHDGMP